MRAADIAHRLRLKKYSRSWRGQCPSCNYPGLTFSVFAARDGSARFYCANGCDRDDLIYAVALVMGHAEWRSTTEPSGNPDSRERNGGRALALWRGSDPTVGTLADRYLTARGLQSIATSRV